jgi:hypothetical protein
MRVLQNLKAPLRSIHAVDSSPLEFKANGEPGTAAAVGAAALPRIESFIARYSSAPFPSQHEAAPPPKTGEPGTATAGKKIRFEHALPLLVEAGNCIYDLRIEFDESTQQWRVAAFTFDGSFGGWVTRGRACFFAFKRALSEGIELATDRALAEIVTTELVSERRAVFIEAKAA